jgi:predicted ATPase/DNA-binding CsgD family transcriptional regulator
MDMSPHNVPRGPTPFIGRQDAVDELRSLVQANRLITLVGPGGVGKTRLAAAVASATASDFRDGARFVELGSTLESHLVSQTVVSTLGLEQQAGIPPLAILSANLSDKVLLLILDNCEHVIGGCAELADTLLKTCPDLHLIVTSRERLRIAGERVWPVPPLSFPTDDTPLSAAQSASEYDAIRLFVERARAVLPSFELTEQNVAAVAHICRHLDGIPLALELAAAWVQTLTVEQIRNRLDDRLRLFSSGGRTALPRQQTLRGAIDWSYALLTNVEQSVFNRLAVFMGGCTLTSAEAVCARTSVAQQDVLPVLDNLVNKSLVLAEEHHGENRYRLLETLRLYGRERLVMSGEGDDVSDRHARHYLSIAEAAERHLWSANLRSWLDLVELEHENMRAALRWSTGRGDTELALRIGTALCRFWSMRGHAREGLRWLDAGLSWETGAPSDVRAQALDAAGHLARDQGDYRHAISLYERGLSLRRELGDVRNEALALTNLAMVKQFQGQYADATTLQEQSLDLFRRLDDEGSVALSLLTLGTMEQLQHRGDRAAELYRAALDIFRRQDNARGMAACLNNLGNLASEQGAVTEAKRCYTETVRLLHELGDEHGRAATLMNLADLAWQSSDRHEATSLSRESLALFSAIGDKRGMAACLSFLAKVALEEHAFERAAMLMGASDAIRESLDGGLADAERSQGPTFRALRDVMGEQRLATSWQTGRTLPLSAAIDLAMAPTPTAAPATEPADPRSPLTARQREVAALIARGFTNRQIADALFIAERTADTHVDHILAKLDVHSRAGIASWATRHGLLAGDEPSATPSTEPRPESRAIPARRR